MQESNAGERKTKDAKSVTPPLPDRAVRVRMPMTARTLRLLFLSLLLMIALIIAIRAIATTAIIPMTADDFVEYWSAGRLNLTGGNPYSGAELFELQLTAAWEDSAPLMMWNPPPALTFIMPLSLLSYGLAHQIWIFVSVVALIGCAEGLWWLYAGSNKQMAWALLLAMLFVPTIQLLRIGQISFLILVGLVGFLLLANKRRWAAAGAVMVLVTLKPHLTYLVWAALGLWFLRERKWTFAVGLIGALSLAWLIPTLFNPQVTSQYLEAVGNAPPLFWRTATLGAYFRTWFGWEREWLQFVPSLFGLCWLIWYWQRRQVWVWKTELPRLLLISAGTMSFGWSFDFVVLLPAIIQMFIWVVGWANRSVQVGVLSVYVLINGVAFWQHQAGVSLQYFAWFPWALLLLYIACQRYQDKMAVLAGLPSPSTPSSMPPSTPAIM